VRPSSEGLPAKAPAAIDLPLQVACGPRLRSLLSLARISLDAKIGLTLRPIWTVPTASGASYVWLRASSFKLQSVV